MRGARWRRCARATRTSSVMRGTVTPVCVALLLSQLTACAEPKCGGSDLKYYDQAIAYHLDKRGVPYRMGADGMVCVDGKHASGFVAADREAAKYFHEVAHLLKDACEERAFVEWADKERLRFDIRGTVRSDGSPGGRMFLLRSFTADELAENRRRLDNDAPTHVSCPPDHALKDERAEPPPAPERKP
jgi:hypothetical protein